jgi:hypothetical protein
MFMITEIEKKELLQQTDVIAERFLNDPKTGTIILKVFSNYLSKTTPTVFYENKINDEMLTNPLEMKSYLSNLMKHMVNIAAEENDYVPEYTTGQLAKFFGVSITSINNWIKDGRFVGIERADKFKQARIPEDTLWISSSGKRIPVSEIIEFYMREQPSTHLTKIEELKLLADEVVFFEKKYGGPYEKTLGCKGEKTEQESRDEQEWAYLLERIDSD